jgi:GNAT superfamily N-acetyltransferase
MKAINSLSEYNLIVNKYNRKAVLSNNYIQNEVTNLIERNQLYVEEYNSNVFFYVKKAIGLRIYYYINDLNEFADFSNYNDLVVEILFRKVLPESEIDFFKKCGLRVNVIRDQYLAVYNTISKATKSVRDIIIEDAQTLTEIKLAQKLFNKTFDKLSGDYISDVECMNMLYSPHRVLMAWSSDKKIFYGAFHLTKEQGSTFFARHVAVAERARGKGVGGALLDAFIERNKINDKTRYLLWVTRQNSPAVNMYLNKGFAPLNKSTISLIK